MTPAAVTAGEVIVGDREDRGGAPPGSTSFASPKSSTLTAPVVADLDIGRLQIAMDDAMVVRRFECLGDLSGDGQRIVEWKCALGNSLREGDALDELHHERASVVPGIARRLHGSVHGRDAGMVEGRERPRLALEARLTVWIAGEGVRQHLDRHLAVQARVDGTIHGAHSIGPEDAADFIVAEPDAWRDAHQRGICMRIASTSAPRFDSGPLPRRFNGYGAGAGPARESALILKVSQ